MESIVASSEANDSNHTNSDISGSVSVVQVIPGQTVQVHRIPASLVTAASLQPAIKAFQVTAWAVLPPSELAVLPLNAVVFR